MTTDNQKPPATKKYTDKDLLQFYIDRCNRAEADNERLREELRKYRGY